MTLPRPPEGTEPGTLHWLRYEHAGCVWNEVDEWDVNGWCLHSRAHWTYLGSAPLPGEQPKPSLTVDQIFEFGFNFAMMWANSRCADRREVGRNLCAPEYIEIGVDPNALAGDGTADTGWSDAKAEVRRAVNARAIIPNDDPPGKAKPLNTAAAQAKVAAWVRTCFGDAAMALHERGMRALEEMDEVAQSVGITRDEAHRLVDVVYDRPAGEPAQELGGTMLGLLALAEVLGLNLGTAAEAEIARVLSKPADHFRQRQAEKVALGVSMQAADIRAAGCIDTEIVEGTVVGFVEPQRNMGEG